MHDVGVHVMGVHVMGSTREGVRSVCVYCGCAQRGRARRGRVENRSFSRCIRKRINISCPVQEKIPVFSNFMSLNHFAYSRFKVGNRLQNLQTTLPINRYSKTYQQILTPVHPRETVHLTRKI
jgi:hypothetical protein